MPLALAALLVQQVGEPHPDFALPRLDGTIGRLSDFRGKKVALIHFASW
jgi:peroxiredoxin